MSQRRKSYTTEKLGVFDLGNERNEINKKNISKNECFRQVAH
jgi:hypothetical protein